MEVSYTPSFLRMFKALPGGLQDEVIAKIELFKNRENHRKLGVHKLSGRLNGRYGFSVNYKTRIVFTYTKKVPKQAILLAIGDHDVYKK